MDPEGARALADRIKSGPPREEEEKTTPRAGDDSPWRTPPPPSAPVRSREAPSPVEIVYLKPRPVRRPDVRIFVRGRDGRLERADS